jgi:hypothetical protein
MMEIMIGGHLAAQLDRGIGKTNIEENKQIHMLLGIPS